MSCRLEESDLGGLELGAPRRSVGARAVLLPFEDRKVEYMEGNLERT